jgi:hypothetical protein
MLSLSYLDLASDLVLAVVNLHVDSVRGYAYASFGTIAASLIGQAYVTKIACRVPWRSKDVMLTLAGLGPMLQGYRCIFGVPPRKNGATSSAQSLSMLKIVEVSFESAPQTVLQLSLLMVDMSNWHRPELIISLLISVVASAILAADAEADMDAPDENTLWMQPYHGYLPDSGPQRQRLLCLLVCFISTYLAMVASSIAAAGSWALWVVLIIFCLHLMHTAAFGTFISRFLFPKGQVSWTSVVGSVAIRIGHFISFFMCPFPATRHPYLVGGPQQAAFIVIGSFGLTLTVIFSTLGLDMKAWYCAVDSIGCSPAALLVIRVSVPGFVLALAALTGFIWAVGPRYRWSFYWSDTLQKDRRRCWQAQPDDADGDARRAKRARHHAGYMSDLVAAWLDRRKGAWAETPPEWLTLEWWAKVPQACRGIVTAADLGLKEPATLGELEC